MKKMSKQDVETVIFENAKTGEALEFQHEQHKAEYGAKHFWKADKKLSQLLSTFSAAESKVVAYILQKTQPTKNEFIGAYKTIARKLECDVTTVRNTFKKMMENDMLAKTDDERIWMLNPRLLVKGDIIVKARLMSKYDSLLGRPLSDWIITDSNGNDPLFLPIEYPTPESLDTAKSDFIKVYRVNDRSANGLAGKAADDVDVGNGGIGHIHADGVCIIADRASKRTMIALIGFKSLPADGLADGVAVLTKEIAELPERGIFRLQCAVCIAVFRPQHHLVGSL